MADSNPMIGSPRPSFNRDRRGLVTFEDLSDSLKDMIEGPVTELEGFVITPWGGFVYIKDTDNNVTFVRR